MATNTGLTKDLLHAGLEAGMAEAAELGVAAAVAIVGAGGELRGYLAPLNTPALAGTVAQGKARTAAGFGRPTNLLANAPTHIQQSLLKLDGVLLMGGGVPVRDTGGVLLGAVGVSGATEDQDHQIASAAADAITSACGPSEMAR